MDMESRKQEYYRARGAAKRAIFKAKDTAFIAHVSSI